VPWPCSRPAFCSRKNRFSPLKKGRRRALRRSFYSLRSVPSQNNSSNGILQKMGDHPWSCTLPPLRQPSYKAAQNNNGQYQLQSLVRVSCPKDNAWITTATHAFFSHPFNCCCRYPRKTNSSQIPAERDKNIHNVISIALRGSNLPILAFGPGRKIACKPARTIFDPTRNRTPIPRSRRNCLAVDHLPPITL
jgi:hypothetical protein